MQCGDSESVESVEVVAVVAPGRGRRDKKGGRTPSMMYTREGSGGCKARWRTASRPAPTRCARPAAAGGAPRNNTMITITF